ncbi:MAG: tetratricopeptide repeat protein [Bdellovibrionales bacterium]
MVSVDYSDMMETAKENFISGNYKLAEPILNQLLLVQNKEPEVFQMLATIYYDQGKFKKAIKTFKRALEIEPSYTDAAIGLSVILNDTGKYEEGKEIFENAKRLLDQKKSRLDRHAEEKIYKKHMELGDLYGNYKMFVEALEQYRKAFDFNIKRDETIVTISNTLVNAKKADEAIKELHHYLDINAHAVSPRLKLGLIYYNGNRIVEAVEQWEKALLAEPENQQALSYIKLAQKTGMTELPAL